MRYAYVVFGIPLLYLAIVVIAGLLVMCPPLYLIAKKASEREPYKSFMQLRTRSKVTFFRLLLTDRRVPLPVKALPVLLVPYLLSPIDIIPDFIPVLGYMDDVGIVLGTFALAIKLTPRELIDDLFRQVRAANSAVS